jgi:biopolymer transport protein ExbD
MKYCILVAFVFAFGKCSAQHPDTVSYVETVNFNQKRTVVVLPNDTSYFIIALKDNKTSVKLNGEWVTLPSNNQLEKFMLRNKGKISPKKIVVVASSKLKYSDFSFILDALKKSDLLLFYLSPAD